MRTLRKGALDFGEMRSKRSAGSSPYTRDYGSRATATVFCFFRRRRTFPKSSARCQISIFLLSLAEREVLANCLFFDQILHKSGRPTTGISIELHTGAYRVICNPICLFDLRSKDTPLMRGRYPSYAWRTAQNTPLMRKEIPGLCVENSEPCTPFRNPRIAMEGGLLQPATFAQLKASHSAASVPAKAATAS